MTSSWSQRVAAAFHLRLPPDLAAWLDEEQWRRAVGAEFCQPRTAEQLLDPDRGSIWAGFMLPDTLPLIGNEYGDWLCLRVGLRGDLTEVVYWCHGGGDWMPYGRTLSEALLYDAAFHVLYDRRFAELVRAARSADDVFAAADWAWQWQSRHGTRLARFWERADQENGRLLEELLEAGVAEVAVRRDLILRHLDSQLKARSEPRVAQQFGMPWEPDFVSWLFDTALIPERSQTQLSRFFGLPAERLFIQNWDAAEAEALRVVAARRDLGWALDIAGWAAERRGELDAAAGHYRTALRASAFADDAVRFRTHWFAEGFGKFAAARLYALRDRLSPAEQANPYLQLFWQNDPATLRVRVRDYWLAEGDRATREGRPADAYQCYYAAGWDCGLNDVGHYAEILDRVVAAAAQAGSPPLAHVARLHRRHLP